MFLVMVTAAPGGGGGWYNPEADGNHNGVNYTGGGGDGPNPGPGTGGHGIVIKFQDLSHQRIISAIILVIDQ